MRKNFVIAVFLILAFLIFIIIDFATYVKKEPVVLETVSCFPEAIDQLSYDQCLYEKNETTAKECRELVDFIESNCADRKLVERYFCTAFLKGDSRYCNCIDLDWYRMNCLAFMTKDPKVCLDVKEAYWRDMCFKDVAIAAKDQKICSKIKSDDWRNMCDAVLTRNLELCKKIQDTEAKQECEESIRELKG